MIPILETDRLVLHPLEIADAEQIQQIFPQWEVVRYLANTVPWPYPADGALRFCRAALSVEAQGKEWHWTLRMREAPQQVVGVVSLMTAENNNRGFWLDPRLHGNGLMSEAVEAVTGYWFGVLGFSVLRAPKAVPNIASRRISEKSGMRVVATEERDFVSGRFPGEVWEITAEEWARHRAGR